VKVLRESYEIPARQASQPEAVSNSELKQTRGSRAGSGETGAEAMTDAVNFVMLIAASAGSMAFGVLGAYGLLRVAFSMMRPQGRAPVAAAPQVAQSEI
jgi:hypothetical protein